MADMENTTEAISKEKSLQCNFCSKIFTKRKNLNIHLCIHTGERKLSCSICGKRFIQSCHLKRHYRSHAGEKPFQCDICSKFFSQNGHLKVHMKSHFGNKNFVCEFCQRSFVQNSQLKRHMKSHLTERPYVCATCNKSYKFSDHLHAHLRTHTGEMPYKCGTCDKSFHTSANLNAHRKVHDKYVDRKFKCLLCVKKFHTKHCLAKHLVVHSQDNAYSCNFCCKTFKQRTSLKVHMDGHGNELESKNKTCVICQKTFLTFNKLKEHVMEHCISTTFQCEICDKVFRVNSNLQMHYSQHTGYKMAYRCLENNCDLEFTTVAVIRNHIFKNHRSDLNEDEKVKLLHVVDDDVEEEQEHSSKQTLFQENQGTPQNIGVHKKTNHCEKLYQCPVNCGSTFKNIMNLSNHLQIHVAEEENCQEDLEGNCEERKDKHSHSGTEHGSKNKQGLDVISSDISESNQIHCLTRRGDNQQPNGQVITFSGVDTLSNNRMFRIGQVCSELLTVDYGCTNEEEKNTLVTQTPQIQCQISETDYVPNVNLTQQSKEAITSVVMVPLSTTEQRGIDVSTKTTPVLSSGVTHSSSKLPDQVNTSELNPRNGVTSCIESLLTVGEVILQGSPASGYLETNAVNVDIPPGDKEVTETAVIFQDPHQTIEAIKSETEEIVSTQESTGDSCTSQNSKTKDQSGPSYNNMEYVSSQQQREGSILETQTCVGDRNLREFSVDVNQESVSHSRVNSHVLQQSNSSTVTYSSDGQIAYTRPLTAEEMGHDYPGTSMVTNSCDSEAVSMDLETDGRLEVISGSSTVDRQHTVMFECPLCDSYFSTKSQLKEHLQVHLGAGQRSENILVSIVMYLCHLCEEEFTDKETLRNHLQEKHSQSYVIQNV